MNFKLLLIISLIVLFSSVTLSSAVFDDDFQNHPDDNITQGGTDTLWECNVPVYGNFIITPACEQYNKGLRLRSAPTGWSYRDMKTIFPFGTNHVMFTLKSSTLSTLNVDHFSVYIYNQYDVYQDSIFLKPSSAVWICPTDDILLEIQKSGTDLYLYINGTLYGDVGNIGNNDDIGYIRFYQYGASYRETVIDTVTTDGYLLGIGTEESPDTWMNVDTDDEINIEWVVKTVDPYGSWTDHTYQVITKWLDTNQVVNTTILPTDFKPNGYVTYNRTEIAPIPNYGTYRFDLTMDGTLKESCYMSFIPIGDSGTLYWDKVNYVSGETGTATYQYSSFNPTLYNYYIKTYDINGGLIDTQTLSAVSGTADVTFLGWDVSSYYSLLIIEEKAGGSEYSLAFDTFDTVDAVAMSGITYDVTNNVSLGTTHVNFTQSTAWYNTTSNINGNYSLISLSSGAQITHHASKINYTHESFLFTPPTSGYYSMDLYLFPNNITRTTHAVEGMIIDDAMYQGIPGATVNIYNSTWNTTTTANSMGYYRFDNLWCNSTAITNEVFNTGAAGSWVQLNNSKIVTGSQVVTNITTSTVYFNNTDYLMNYSAGTIQINASGNMSTNNDTYINYTYYLPTEYIVNSTSPGYDDSTDYNVIVNSWTIQNIPLRAIYSLNVTAVDSVTGAKIQEFTVVVDGESRDVINGTTTYYKNYGLYTITVSSEGYYSSQENTMMDRNRDVQLSLLPVDSEYYPAHYVEFIVCSIWGVKYPGVTVNVYNSTDTSGDTLLNGTTGVDGGITFRMNENVRYTMVFTGGGITEKIINIYPKNSRYYIIVSYDGDTFDDDSIESNIIMTGVIHYPGVNGSVDVSYYDISDNTTALNFTIKERLVNGTYIIIDSYDSFANMSEGDHRFILSGYADKEYLVYVNYTHSEYGERVRFFAISYGNTIQVLNDILNPFVRGMLAIFILFGVGMIFGVANREIGALLVSITAAIFHSMHWFDYFGVSTLVLWVGISLAVIVSIAAIFGKKTEEGRF